MKKMWWIVFVTPVLVACGGGYNPDKDFAKSALSLGDSRYVQLSNGKGLMTDSAPTMQSGANFEVHFTLQDGGRLNLYTFASSDLSQGLNFSFVRQGTALKVSLSHQGITQDLSALFQNFDASQAQTFSFDVHNNERPAHILLWSGEKKPGLNHRNTTYNSAEDSLDLGYDSSPGNGLGRAWGFEQIGSELINARLTTPQDSH